MLILQRPWTEQPGALEQIPDAGYTGAWGYASGAMLQNAARPGVLVNTSGSLDPLGKGIVFSCNGSSTKFEDTAFTGATALPLTLMCHVYLNAAQNNRNILTATVGTGLTTIFTIWIDAGNKYTAQHYDGANAVATGATSEALRWTHLAAVFRSMSSREIWVDGVLSGSNTGVNTSFVAPNRAAIGYAPWGGQYFNGRVLAPVIANRALTASEIQDHKLNPWGILNPRRIYIPTATAAASTYTLSAATYAPGSLTATGVTPRVTVTVA